MNRYFIPWEGRRDYPKRSFAKLDQIEPPNLQEAGEVTFAFDAIDAGWSGFGPNKLLSLDLGGVERSRAFWEHRFGPPEDRAVVGPDPFDDLPMYRIEVTLPGADPWAKDLVASDGKWLEIELNDHDGRKVDVFGGLFMAPIEARLAHFPGVAPQNEILQRLFDMEDWPDATRDELNAALQLRCEIDRLLVFDVGQGSATGLACRCECVMSYFDVGCGVYRNAKTQPSQISFCTHQAPYVILSHWDADHWAGATLDRDLLKLTWIAPRQSIGPSHKALGNDILKAGGNLLIVPTALSPLRWGNSNQSFELRRCTGKDRNGSGLALVAEDFPSQRGWLLTGDAGYQYIPGPLPSDLAAVVVPHHGADMGTASKPPNHSGNPYSRLLYSFGPDNAHGKTSVRHPTQAAVTAHVGSGWLHGSWVPPPPGFALAGQPVLATASHLTTHQTGIAVGWTAPPAPLQGHLASCPKVMPITQS